MNIKSEKDIEGYILNRNDIVTFKVKGLTLRYRVEANYLCIESYGNSIIFQSIGVNPYEFCEQHYGHEVCNGDWPESKYEDYEALTRVVRAIYRKFDKTPQGDSKLTFNFINKSI